MPEVSVIIPCYNQAAYLAQSVASVIGQTFPDWECIIVNDGSLDDTEAIATSFVQKDQRIRYVMQKNRGLAAARNRGLDQIKGSFVQFLDADDWIAPTKFERQLRPMTLMADPVVSYCDYDRYFDDPQLASENGIRMSPDLDVDDPLRDLAARWESGLTIPAHCFLLDARFFTRRGVRFDESLGNHEDWDCWMQVLANKPAVLHVPEVLATYRFRSNSLATDLKSMRKGFLEAIGKQQRLFPEDGEIHGVLAETKRRVSRQYRDFKFPRSTYLQARQETTKALRAYMPPSLLRVLKKLAIENK